MVELCLKHKMLLVYNNNMLCHSRISQDFFCVADVTVYVAIIWWQCLFCDHVMLDMRQKHTEFQSQQIKCYFFASTHWRCLIVAFSWTFVVPLVLVLVLIRQSDLLVISVKKLTTVLAVALLTWDRLVTRSTLLSWKWQLIGIS